METYKEAVTNGIKYFFLYLKDGKSRAYLCEPNELLESAKPEDSGLHDLPSHFLENETTELVLPEYLASEVELYQYVEFYIKNGRHPEMYLFNLTDRKSSLRGRLP